MGWTPEVPRHGGDKSFADHSYSEVESAAFPHACARRVPLPESGKPFLALIVYWGKRPPVIGLDIRPQAS